MIARSDAAVPSMLAKTSRVSTQIGHVRFSPRSLTSAGIKPGSTSLPASWAMAE